MNKLVSLLGLFRRGSIVANPEKWKKRQIDANALALVIVAAFQTLKAYGYDLFMDADTATAIAVGIIGVVNWVLTITTTEKVGLPPVADIPAPPLHEPIEMGNPDDRA